ncbi:MAG: hypothetical protein AABX51_07830 [Nanoarchaeota archaeon]
MRESIFFMFILLIFSAHSAYGTPPTQSPLPYFLLQTNDSVLSDIDSKATLIKHSKEILALINEFDPTDFKYFLEDNIILFANAKSKKADDWRYYELAVPNSNKKIGTTLNFYVTEDGNIYLLTLSRNLNWTAIEQHSRLFLSYKYPIMELWESEYKNLSKDYNGLPEINALCKDSLTTEEMENLSDIIVDVKVKKVYKTSRSKEIRIDINSVVKGNFSGHKIVMRSFLIKNNSITEGKNLRLYIKKYGELGKEHHRLLCGTHSIKMINSGNFFSSIFDFFSNLFRI